MTIGVLLVDDSNYMRSRLKNAFDDRFYVVDEVPNGVKAVQTYKEHRDEIDVVLMDIVMKKANGVKATAAIKKQIDSDARVIMCTSVGQHRKMKLAAEAGADGYVTKPFDDDDVLAAIDDVLERPPA